MGSIKRLLIANRGEIACRIIFAARDLGITSYAVYSDADRNSKHVKLADFAISLNGLEASESYLNLDKLLEIIQEHKIDAVHPGYGFFSENAEFARKIQEAGVIFIGPSAEVIENLGSKIKARAIAKAAGVPIVPGYQGKLDTDEDVKKVLAKLGFPLLIKASAGGGGRGMRVLREAHHALEELAAARNEAMKFFKDDQLFIERYIEKPRHIEVQILADQHGNVVHLGDRECSMQRKHQKVIEEAPSPSISQSLREKLYQASISLAKECQYSNAGTVEFIVDDQDQFYFLEVNTRLQVEHPVTEMITGIDLVKAQIKVAEGKHLPFTQEDVKFQGHSIELRLYAEDPSRQFFPSHGKVALLIEPDGPFHRIDSYLQEGTEISTYFDPMLAKLVVKGFNRKEALQNLNALTSRYVLLGIQHNLNFLIDLVASEAFQQGKYSTDFIAKFLETWQDSELDEKEIDSFDDQSMIMFSEQENLPKDLIHFRNV